MTGYQRFLLAIIALLASGAVVACGGGGTGSQVGKANLTYADAGAVSQAFATARHPCASYAAQTPSGLGSNFVDTEASCTLDGVHLTIDTFKDTAAETNWMGFLKTSACASASGYSFIEGNRWVITGTVGGLASAIARTIVGGIAKADLCGGSATASSSTHQLQQPSP